MSDLIDESSQPEGSNFDNDFEKLDPYSPESQADIIMGDHGEEFVSSTSQMDQQDMPEEDLYTQSVPSLASVSEAEPLVDISPVLIASEPLIPDLAPQQPVSSTFEFEEKSEPSPQRSLAPEPEPVETPTAKPQPPTIESWLHAVDPRVASVTEETSSVFQPVVDLVYWRDIKKTGVVFGSVLVVLFSLALFSVLSVVAYLSLAALTVTVSFRVYKNVLGAIQKTGEGHPFKQYLEVDIALPEEKVHELADVVMGHVTCSLNQLRRVFLVEDMIDSIKFGLLLWVLTYIGSWFNGMTLIILGVVGVFTLPKVYETYQVQIDQYIDLAKTQIKNIIKQVQEKIPLPGKKKSA